MVISLILLSWETLSQYEKFIAFLVDTVKHTIGWAGIIYHPNYVISVVPKLNTRQMDESRWPILYQLLSFETTDDTWCLVQFTSSQKYSRYHRYNYNYNYNIL